MGRKRTAQSSSDDHIARRTRRRTHWRTNEEWRFHHTTSGNPPHDDELDSNDVHIGENSGQSGDNDGQPGVNDVQCGDSVVQPGGESQLGDNVVHRPSQPTDESRVAQRCNSGHSVRSRRQGNESGASEQILTPIRDSVHNGDRIQLGNAEQQGQYDHVANVTQEKGKPSARTIYDAIEEERVATHLQNDEVENKDHSTTDLLAAQANIDRGPPPAVEDFELQTSHRGTESQRVPTNINSALLSTKQLLLKATGESADTLDSFVSRTLQTMKRCLNQTSMTGMILLYGSIPISCAQYGVVSSLVSAYSDSIMSLLPPDVRETISKFNCSLSKVRKTVMDFIISNLVPTSLKISVDANHKSVKPEEVWLLPETLVELQLPSPEVLEEDLNELTNPVEGNTVGTEDTTSLQATHSRHGRSEGTSLPTGSAANKKECFIVHVSSWGKYDIANTTFLSILKSQQKLSLGPSSIPSRSFANSPIITDPHSTINRDRLLYVKTNGGTTKRGAIPGDVLQLASYVSSTSSNFVTQLLQHGWSSETDLSSFRGVFRATWSAGSKTSYLASSSKDTNNVGSQASASIPLREELPTSLHPILDFLDSLLISPVDMEKLNRDHRQSSRNNTNTSTYSKIKRSILPGDLCSIITNSDECDPHHDQIVAVLVDRFFRFNRWPSRKFILWIHLRPIARTISPGDILSITLSTGQPTIIQHSPTIPPVIETNKNITGFLADGTRYYVYRFLLYSDDFGPRSTLFPRGSVGGVYLKPIDLPFPMLRCPRCNHPVSLAPTGVDSNIVIEQIVDDIVHGTLHGFDAVDSDGSPCKLFLRLVGYIGDYPESSSVIDVMKHSARAPCTVCNMRYNKMVDGPTYCYSKTASSLNSSFTRGWFRTKSIRYSDISKDHSKWMGMNDGSLQSIVNSKDGSWVLLKLALAFDKMTATGQMAPMTSDNVPVVPCVFDPYSYNIVAPDHCVAGVIKSTVHVCFGELTKQDACVLDCLLTKTISNWGVTGHSSVYNVKTQRLNGLSISTLFCILSVLPTIMRSWGLHEKMKSFSVLESFSKLVSLMYWWPTSADDTMDNIRMEIGQQR